MAVKMALIFSLLVIFCSLVTSDRIKSDTDSSTFIPRTKGVLPYLCYQESMVPSCLCTSHPWFQIVCNGTEVTMETLQTLTLAIREANGISDASSLTIPDLYIQNTDLTELDLDLLDPGHSEMEFSFFCVNSNRKLKTIKGGTMRITTFVLELADNGFTDSDLIGGIGKIFESTAYRVRTLYLDRNQLTGNPEMFNYLRLWHPDVSAVDLGQNQMKVGGGQFENFTSIGVLRLEGNGLEELGENAFRFNLHWPHPDGLRQIFMDGNNLTNDKIHPTAFSGVNGPYRFLMENNQFEYLSAANFEELLSMPVENPGFTQRVEVTGNKFICDERMRWIHDKRDVFEKHLEGVDCTNDPGKNVFTTELYD